MTLAHPLASPSPRCSRSALGWRSRSRAATRRRCRAPPPRCSAAPPAGAGEPTATSLVLQAAVRAAPGDPPARDRRSPPRTCRRCARPATSASTRAPTALLRRAAARAPARPRRADRRSGTLALARHDFARRAGAGPPRAGRSPDARAADPVVVDALVELGRYGDAAARRCRRWSTPSRTSPPTRACRTSASCTATSTAPSTRCGARSPPAAPCRRTSPTSRACSATSSSRAGTTARHGARTRPALARRAGLRARARPASRGWTARTATSAARSRAGGAVVERLPLPEYVDRRSARPSWRRAGAPTARSDLALVGAERAAARGRGVNTDVELALFEADHGDPRRGVELARRGLGEGAERALGRRAGLGADARRPARRRACAGRGGRCGSARSTPGCASTRA